MWHPTVGLLCANLVALGAEYVLAVAAVETATACKAREAWVPLGVPGVIKIQEEVSLRAYEEASVGDLEATDGNVGLTVGLVEPHALVKLAYGPTERHSATDALEDDVAAHDSTLNTPSLLTAPTLVRTSAPLRFP